MALDAIFVTLKADDVTDFLYSRLPLASSIRLAWVEQYATHTSDLSSF